MISDMQIKTTICFPSFLVAALFLLVPECVPAHGQSYGDVVKGKAFVERNCARCHAVGLNDDSHLPEAPALRTLHNRYPIDSLSEAFAEGIVTAHPEMPQFELDTQTISNMLAYIESLAGPGG